MLVLLGCGLIEITVRGGFAGISGKTALFLVPANATPVLAGGVAALCWVAFKVGALSYGGGFVIIPLMQHDAVVTYHWMTGTQFLNAVALGQITPGPVVQTVAVVGYAAGGIGGGLLAALVAFAPSFCFIIAGAPHFDRLAPTRASRPSSPVRVQRSSGRSPDPRSRSGGNLRISGNSGSWVWLRYGCSASGAVSSPPCLPPESSASSP